MVELEISIVFECPYCGRSMTEDVDQDALNYEGSVRCTPVGGGCGKTFWVRYAMTCQADVSKIACYDDGKGAKQQTA